MKGKYRGVLAALFVLGICLTAVLALSEDIAVHRIKTITSTEVLDDNSWVDTVSYLVEPRPVVSVVVQYLILGMFTLLFSIGGYYIGVDM